MTTFRITTNDFKPELHPRDDEGKFTETPGGGLPDIDFNDFGTEEDRQNVSETFNEWAAFPTSEGTTPLWDAAVSGEEFDEDARFMANIPTPEFGGSFLGSPQPEKQESIAEYNEWLAERLREEHGDSVTAFRMLHGDAADTLREGGSLEPRALGSWTTSEEAFEEVAAQVEPNAKEGLEGSVVVKKEIPVEYVMGVHAANDNLAARGEKELVAALPESEDLSDAEITEATEVIDS